MPGDRAARLARDYVYLRHLAVTLGPTSGRASTKLNDEAGLIQRTAVQLLGPEVWNRLVDEAEADQ